MNWGYKITILYLSFVALIVFLVVGSTQYKVQLVSPDYYQEEITYDLKAEKMANAKLIQDSVSIDYDVKEQQIHIQLPSKRVLKGNIQFYRPSNSQLDKKFPIHPGEWDKVIEVRQFSRGLWKVQLEWEGKEKSYFLERTIIL
ncbi:MAG: FixH family protein [Bacteroidota bacterium]